MLGRIRGEGETRRQGEGERGDKEKEKIYPIFHFSGIFTIFTIMPMICS